MSDKRVYTACILVIGNEILSGRTKDENIAHLAKTLNEWGIRVRECRVIPDVEDTIVRTVNEVRAAFDYVFTTGGIGPTHDDITANSIAKAFGVKNVIHPEALAILVGHYGGRDKVNPARLRMAHAPEGAELIHNPVSKAPGFRIGNVYVMAGVPRIMQNMLEGLKGKLAGGDPVRATSIDAGMPEGILAEGLGAIQNRFPDVDIGSYPYSRNGKHGTSLVMRTADVARLNAATEEVRTLVRQMGGNPIDEAVG